MPSWLRRKLEGQAAEPASATSARGAVASAGAARARLYAHSRQSATVLHGGDDEQGGGGRAAAAPGQRKRPRVSGAAVVDSSVRTRRPGSVQGFWSDESEEDDIEEPAARPRPKRPRASPQRKTFKRGSSPRRVQVAEQHAGATRHEEEYSSPDSLDPNEPEFPKLVDPPFKSEKVPLKLSPSDELQGGQTSLAEAPVDAETLTVPASAAQYLRGYQKDGIKWLYQQYIRNLGGVLGDDMGASRVNRGYRFK